MRCFVPSSMPISRAFPPETRPEGNGPPVEQAEAWMSLQMPMVEIS